MEPEESNTKENLNRTSNVIKLGIERGQKKAIEVRGIPDEDSLLVLQIRNPRNKDKNQYPVVLEGEKVIEYKVSGSSVDERDEGMAVELAVECSAIPYRLQGNLKLPDDFIQRDCWISSGY